MRNKINGFAWISILLFVSISTSCTTSSSSGKWISYEVSRVQELAVLRMMSAQEAELFKKNNKHIAEVVLGNKLYAAFWADALQSDYAILKRKGNGFELVKVKQIGTAIVKKYEGVRIETHMGVEKKKWISEIRIE